VKYSKIINDWHASSQYQTVYDQGNTEFKKFILKNIDYYTEENLLETIEELKDSNNQDRDSGEFLKRRLNEKLIKYWTED